MFREQLDMLGISRAKPKPTSVDATPTLALSYAASARPGRRITGKDAQAEGAGPTGGSRSEEAPHTENGPPSVRPSQSQAAGFVGEIPGTALIDQRQIQIPRMAKSPSGGGIWRGGGGQDFRAEKVRHGHTNGRRAVAETDGDLLVSAFALR
jgi:hypothetical protein